jgi:hypothetical protein
MLGLEAVDGRLVLDPQVPESLGQIALCGLTAFGKSWDLTAQANRADLQPAS